MTPISSFECLKVITFRELRSELLWAYDDEVAVSNLSSDMSPVQTIAWLIRRGGVLIRQGSDVVTATPGTWVFPAMMRGRQEFKPGTKLLSIRFTTRWLDSRRSLFDHRRAVLISSVDAPELEQTGSNLAKAVRTHAGNVQIELHSRAIDVGAHFAIQARFSDWLSAYANAMQRVAGMKPKLPVVRDARAIAAMRLVEDHPFAQPLREATIARRIGLSISQMNRMFHRYYDSTPKRWFDARRREHAVNALIYSDAQIKSVAFSLGFSSLPHFTKWFRRQTGQAPLMFRRTRRLSSVDGAVKD